MKGDNIKNGIPIDRDSFSLKLINKPINISREDSMSFDDTLRKSSGLS